MNLIRSKFHSLHSIKQNKLALSYKDDKRFINGDGITTLAHGHWSLMNLDLFNELCRKKIQLAPQLENQSQCRRKTTQLVSRNKTTQLNRRKQLKLGNMNETTQQEKTTQLSSRNEQLNSAAGTKTTQLVSGNETTQLCTAVDRLQPPAPPLQQNRLFLPTYHSQLLQVHY
ncbi:hypothetical protein TNCV_726421 [Trichonephila clavipes]|nr:hypothetical protein TNCV_726421 [Trichonephila clavipes]